MKKTIKALVIGDAMIMGSEFKAAAEKYLGDVLAEIKVGNWETSWPKLQDRRLVVEKKGPEVEVVDSLILSREATRSFWRGCSFPSPRRYSPPCPGCALPAFRARGSKM